MKRYILSTIKVILAFSILSVCSTGYSDQKYPDIKDEVNSSTKGNPKGWEIDETNTGLKGNYSKLKNIVPDEVGSLSGNTIYITRNNIKITDKQIPYVVIVEGKNIIFERCRFQPTACGKGMPLITSTATRAIFKDCEMDFSLIPLDQVYMSIAITLIGDIYRCNIHGSSTGIAINNIGSNYTSIAEGNYIHGLRHQPPAHIDGLTIRRSDGSGGIIIRNNKIKVDVPATGALFIQPWQGHINNVLIEGNLLQGYGNCLALEFRSNGYGNNMRAINNRIDAWTVQGAGPWYGYVDGGEGWLEWKENYSYDSSAKDNKGKIIKMKTRK